MSDIAQDHPRRRAMSAEVNARRQAMAIVQPFNRQIGTWQAALARISILAERGGDRSYPGLADEAHALIGAIEVQQRNLASARADLPDDVAGNSRIADTASALERLSGGLRQALDVIDPAGRA
jgi:hypothetical protein